MRTMKAAVLYDHHTPMVVEEVQLDDPAPNEVLVKVAAGGVCRTDLHVLKGEWTPPLPIVLGHEAAGYVEAVGAGVTRVRPGDPVVLTFKPHCGYCETCLTGRPHVCTGFGGSGVALPGGHRRPSQRRSQGAGDRLPRQLHARHPSLVDLLQERAVRNGRSGRGLRTQQRICIPHQRDRQHEPPRS